MVDLFLGSEFVGNERFFWIDRSCKYVTIHDMNIYTSFKFIDCYLSGELRKEVIPDLRNGAFAYFKLGSSDPVAFSLLGFIGFNEFCRKVNEIYGIFQEVSEQKMDNDCPFERSKGNIRYFPSKVS